MTHAIIDNARRHARYRKARSLILDVTVKMISRRLDDVPFGAWDVRAERVIARCERLLRPARQQQAARRRRFGLR